MFEYITVWLANTKNYMQEDKMNSLELQSLFTQIVGLGIGAVAFFTNAPIGYHVVGLLVLVLGWLGGVVVMAADTTVLKIHYMLTTSEEEEDEEEVSTKDIK